MKTAISIPEDLFIAAERIARQLGIPRSRLYSWALEEFLSKHSKEQIKQKLNEIYKNEESSIENGLIQAQMEAIKKDDATW